jgi:hypothetical protein
LNTRPKPGKTTSPLDIPLSELCATRFDVSSVNASKARELNNLAVKRMEFFKKLRSMDFLKHPTYKEQAQKDTIHVMSLDHLSEQNPQDLCKYLLGLVKAVVARCKATMSSGMAEQVVVWGDLLSAKLLHGISTGLLQEVRCFVYSYGQLHRRFNGINNKQLTFGLKSQMGIQGTLWNLLSHRSKSLKVDISQSYHHWSDSLDILRCALFLHCLCYHLKIKDLNSEPPCWKTEYGNIKGQKKVLSSKQQVLNRGVNLTIDMLNSNHDPDRLIELIELRGPSVSELYIEVTGTKAYQCNKSFPEGGRCTHRFKKLEALVEHYLKSHPWWVKCDQCSHPISGRTHLCVNTKCPGWNATENFQNEDEVRNYYIRLLDQLSLDKTMETSIDTGDGRRLHSGEMLEQYNLTDTVSFLKKNRKKQKKTAANFDQQEDLATEEKLEEASLLDEQDESSAELCRRWFNQLLVCVCVCGGV